MKLNINGIPDLRIKQTFDFLQMNKGNLTAGQNQFIRSLLRQYKARGLSEKQIAVLFDIAKHLQPDKELIIRQNY